MRNYPYHFIKGAYNFFHHLAVGGPNEHNGSEPVPVDISKSLDDLDNTMRNGTPEQKAEAAGGVAAGWTLGKASTGKTTPISEMNEVPKGTTIFNEGGTTTILGGKGTLTLTSDRLTGELSINNKSIFIEATVKVENGVLKISDLGVRNSLGNYNNTDIVNQIGPSTYIKLLNELKKLRQEGGFKEGKLKYERMKPEESKLKSRGDTTISF